MSGRRAGVLLHPSSLPGRYGIGAFGPEASEFLSFLAATGQRVWQMLPLVPVGADGCPYQSCSVFAGNPLLISVDRLLDAGMVGRAEAAAALPEPPGHRVDYGSAAKAMSGLLAAAYRTAGHSAEVDRFRDREAYWLDDYALYMALRRRHGPSWSRWPVELATREPSALRAFEAEHAAETRYFRFEQYLFAEHFGAVRAEARSLGIEIMGDLAMFVALDSAEVWAHPGLFQVDGRGTPAAVAGFPPDVFSRDGQVWGNALYAWEAHRRDGFSWWVDRLRRASDLFDIVRLDHFRGFWRYWAIPAAGRATEGHWEDGPGPALFTALRERAGGPRLVAEDLGPVTPEVQRLRTQAGIAGMRVLQFAFGGDENPHLPHHIRPDCVAYTGTHDNDTTAGWWDSGTADLRYRVQRYLGRGGDADGADIAWELARLAHSSVAELAILPMQDVLRLGSGARMNTPGPGPGNWSWRLEPDDLRPTIEFALKTLTSAYGRDPLADERLPAQST
jgi:4-alpha-glucanotransferase